MKGSLFRKYATVLMLFVGIALIVGGGMQAMFNYADTRAQVELRQGVEARAAAGRIRDYLRSLESEVHEMSGLPWGGGLAPEGRLEEFQRLLRLVPAISEMRSADEVGREQLRASRIEPDEVGTGKPVENRAAFIGARKDGVYYGGTYFKDGSEPYMTIALRDEGSDGRVTMADVNLKFVGDLIREVRFGREGRAYVIDGERHLVAHPDTRHVLRRTTISGFVPAGAMGPTASATQDNLDGVRVLTTYAPVGIAGWWVFVEQPTGEAFAPVYASIARTVALFVLGIALALAASYILAQRLAQPILALQHGAARLAAGELATRIDVRTGDEVEALADEFNHMAGELQDLYTGLERKVAEKTAELEAANRHKSEFLANMSHELRTPLNAVIGFSEVLKERMFGDLNPKQLEYVRDIHGSGQHLLSLINDILDLSKIEAGYMELDVRDFDVAAAVGNCCVLIRERAVRQRVRCDCAVEPGVTTWPGDERKFKQVLLNLLSNAVKFTPPGGNVDLRARADSDWLVVTVRDTGIGIAPEEREAIFREFHQVRSSGSAKHEGTGLGLSLSRRLVQLHHGTLTVESEVGRGSTFTASFPGRERRRAHG
jgi:signal transduction histidine kinase